MNQTGLPERRQGSLASGNAELLDHLRPADGFALDALGELGRDAAGDGEAEDVEILEHAVLLEEAA
jgi:hypothetical protein